jgi:hypothetical protein
MFKLVLNFNGILIIQCIEYTVVNNRRTNQLTTIVSCEYCIYQCCTRYKQLNYETFRSL